jgi:uncharacterized protein
LRLLDSTWRAHPPDAETRAAGMPDNLRANTVANIRECERFVPACLSRAAWQRLEALLRGWFEANQHVFTRRVMQDRIRDGHGDLKPGNIAFIEGKPVVTDCIEFNPQFRRLDTLAEVAFLATGLEQLGAFATATDVLAAYRRVTGDDYPEPLRRYYQAHLACVMGKVTALQLDDPELSPRQREHAAALAAHNFALADFHAREPHVIVVCGIMGCGKSTVANALSRNLGWPVVNSDEERKRMFNVAPTQRLPQSAYTDEVSSRVYQRLYDAAEHAGVGVILDAQFTAREFRRAVLQAAKRAGGQATFVLCDAPDDLVRKRMRLRSREAGRISDATEDLLEQARQRFEPVAEAEGFDLLRVNTEGQPEEAISGVKECLLGPAFNPDLAKTAHP